MIGLVAGVMETGYLSSIRHDLVRDMIFFNIVIIGFFIVGGGIIHRWVIRRLQGLRQSIQSLSRSEFIPAEQKGKDEISEIAGVFNEMAREIRVARRKLEVSENYLRNLIDNISDMVVVIDRDHRIRFVNREALEYLGLEADEVIGGLCHRVFHGLEVPCNMDDTINDECGLGAAFMGEVFSTVHTNHGDEGPSYTYVRYIPFHDGGDIPYVIVMAREITINYRLNEQRKILAEFGKNLNRIETVDEYFDRLVQLGEGVCRADMASVYMIDYSEGRLYRQTRPGRCGPLAEALREMDIDECVASHAIETGRTKISESMDEFPESRLKPLVEDAGVQTVVSIPLKRGDRVIGVYNIAYRMRHYFRNADGEFFSILEDLINRTFARIIHLNELRAETERVSTLAGLITTLSETEGTDEALGVIVSSVRRLLHADICGVMLYDEMKERVRLVSLEGMEEPLHGELAFDISGFPFRFDRYDNTLSTINILQDRRFTPLYPLAERLGFRSIFARCLFSRKGEKLGIIFGLWKEERLPLLDEIVLFNSFSGSAEIALEKALLYEDLRMERQKVEDIFNSISDPFFVTDREFTITITNRAFRKFVNDWRHAGKKCFELVHGEGSPDMDCPHYETLLTGESVVKEISSERGDYLYTASPLHDGKGNITGVIHLLKDISFLRKVEEEKERLHEQLLQAQKIESIGNLAGGVAHDFNNILTAVLGHAELAMMKTGDPAVKRSLDVIKGAAEKARDLTRQLLLYGRKTPMDRRVHDLGEVVVDALKMIERVIGENIDLIYLPHKVSLHVSIDRTQITQVLLNLCVNARDAMPDGGRITIRTGRAVPPHEALPRERKRSGDEMVYFEVTDTGRGVPDEMREKIFEPFFTTKQEGRGTGLGLSVVYSVVDSHGGLVSIRSGNHGGTVFSVYLPDVKNISRIARCDDGGKAIPGGEERVLIVDDEDFVRRTGKSLLESLGYQVEVASSGREGIEAFQRVDGKFALVLSDQRMPDMKGTELYREISRLKPDVKFMIMTGYGKHEIEDDITYRINGVIEKPFSLNELACRVRDALDGND